MAKTISIVTPTYKQGKFIAKTIESILTQEGDFYIDYIIMDAVSPDNTIEEIKKYEKLLQDNCSVSEIAGLKYYVTSNNAFKFNRCLGISYRWWSKKDNGQSDAINQGFKLAKGDISTWLNSDDYFVDNKVLATVVEVWNNNNVDVVVGDTIALDGEGKEIWRQTPRLPSLYSLLYKNETPQQPAIFFSQELITKVNGVDESLHYVMDVDLWIRFCFAHARFFKVWKYFAVQVYHDEAKSTQGSSMLEMFAPEDKMIKAKYKSQLSSMQRSWYEFLQNIPTPIKDVMNKVVNLARKIV